MTDQDIQDNQPEGQLNDRSRLYWFFYNLKKNAISWLGRVWKSKPILVISLVLVVIYLLFTGRATVQPIFLSIRKYWLLALLICGLFWIYLRVINNRTFVKSILPTVLLLVSLIIMYLFGPPVYKYLSLYSHYQSINKVKIQDFPETGHERIQPIQSVQTLINQSALEETEDATTPKYMRGSDGQYYFTSGVGPADGYKIQQFSKNMYEVIKAKGNLPSPDFSGSAKNEVDFYTGEFLLFSKNIENAVIKKFDPIQYLSYELGEPLFLENDNGAWVQVVPLMKWKGWLFPRPVFGGVMVVSQGDEDGYFGRVLFGSGMFIGPDEIHLHKYLVGQNLMPQKVCDYIAESFRFTRGFWAPMPGNREGDIRIPKLHEEQSSQPFVTYFDFKDNPKLYNYYGLEPFQEKKRSLIVSLLIPGDRDDVVYFADHRESGDNFNGSSSVAQKIVESKKNYDWSQSYPAESRPYIREINGEMRFFWLSTIVTKSSKNEEEYIGGSVPELTLTDAKVGKVIWINQDSLMNQESWLRQASGAMKGY